MKPLKILWGGSPCTYWSIAQSPDKREKTAEGQGWELFKNYLIAKDKFRPDLFLYENNKSAAQAIKDQIAEELGVELMYIDSALVSAQSRKRFYAFNWNAEQPEDRGILLRDVLESGIADREKSYCLLTTHQGNARDYFMGHAQIVFNKPIRMGDIGRNSQGARVYNPNGKSVTISGNGGGQGANTGLYFCPITGKYENIYHVENGIITIKDKTYPIQLADGDYIIRKLTPTECERLQTLPDGYTDKGISNTQRYKCLGNGWTAEVIIHILSYALKDIPRDTPIQVLSMYDGIATGRYCLDKMGFTNVEYHAYEIDKYAMQVAMANYPDIIQHGDAFQVRENDWRL